MHRRDADVLRAAQAGNRHARDRIVADNLGIVRSLASYYSGIGLPYDDLAPTPAELAEATGIALEAIVEARGAATAPVSLDQPVLEAVLPDDAAVDPEREAVRHEQTEQLAAAVAQLPTRQREIVRRHFGLGEAPEDIAA